MAYPLAVISERFGPPDSYELRNLQPGIPGPREVRIRVKSAGVNFVDVLMATGKYQVKLPLPCVPGIECAGIIDAVGEDVSSLAVGDRVLVSQGNGQAFAQSRIALAEKAFRIPDAMPFDEAVVFKMNYTTAYHALVQRGHVKPGESLLVLGASGGVGYACIELGKALGAFVIASASSPAKRALAKRAGADMVIDSQSEDWRGDLKAANQGRPVDVIVDPVGGQMSETAFRSLAWNGRHLMIGFAAGDIPRLPTNLAILKGAALIGVDVHQFTVREKQLGLENLANLFALYEAGKLRPPIGHRFPLAAFAEAMSLVASGGSVGRVVLDMPDD